jgi:hypothetical protein
MAEQSVPQNDIEGNDQSHSAPPSLWAIWWDALVLLRPAFAQFCSFLWFTVVVAGITIGTDTFGVTSIVRALKLHPRSYDSLLKHFHGNAVQLELLTRLWATVVVPRLFTEPVLCNGRRVLVGDGIKVGKCGKKMPAVRSLHQQSENKAEYIMGHSYQAVNALVHAGCSVVAVPLSMRIHEGLVWCNARKKTLMNKMLDLLEVVSGHRSFYFVADAYYAAHPIILGLLERGNHLITRVKTNAVGYTQHVHEGPRKKGRPRFYDEKVPLSSLRKKRDAFQTVTSPLYGEQNVILHYIVRDLLWKPVGRLVRFVIVVHPKGTWYLLSTDTSLEALEIIRIYGLRFRIELSFKQAVHTVGTFCYRFWMRSMKPRRFGDGNQYLHRTSSEYREAITRKIHAYHTFVQAGVIAQGLLLYLSATYPKLVWKSFGSWLRTIRPNVAPSEFVVAQALRQSLPHFLASNEERHAFTKFITERQGPDNAEMFGMAA